MRLKGRCQLLNIITLLSDNQREFRRLKAKTAGDWTFLFAGEWSQSPYHQGNVCLYTRWSADKKAWAILCRGFPNRIVAVAEFEKPVELEFACSSMLRQLREQGGEYVDLVHEFGEIDHDLFWKQYRRLN